MSATGVSLYEAVGVDPSAGDNEIREAVASSRCNWQIRSNTPDLSMRQLAEQRIRLIAEAERILLDSELRLDYHERTQTGGSDVETSPRWIIDSFGPRTSHQLDLLRIVEFRATSSGPFVPEIDEWKNPILRTGEDYLQRLAGHCTCYYVPWPGAPVQELSSMPGTTFFHFTSQRVIYLCSEFVTPDEATDFSRDSKTISGSVAGYAATAALNKYAKSKARKEVHNKALGGQIPWEFITQLVLLPLKASGGAALRFDVVAGDATYLLYLMMPDADLTWARQYAEWCTRAALYHRKETFADSLFGSERELIEYQMRECRPDFGGDGSLSYRLPVAFDGTHALLLA